MVSAKLSRDSNNTASTKMYLQLNVRRETMFLLLYTVVSNLISITAGGTYGYSSVVLPILTNNTSSVVLNATEESFFASIILITQMIGCLLCPISMKYGRRGNLMISGVSFSLGWSLIASSYNVIQLFVGRALTGFALGIYVYSIQIYLEEISIALWREAVGVTPMLSNYIGILIVYFLGFVIKNNWRLIAVFFIVLSIFFVLCNIFFMCESPVWLLCKGRKEEAKIALFRIRGLRQETREFQEEFDRMINYIELTNNLEISRKCQSDSSSTKKTKRRSFLARSVWSKLKSIQRITLLPEVWKPFVIINLYFFFEQFSGILVILSYTVDIITKINITIDPFLITVIIGIIQVITTTISICCSMRIGRRIMSIVSGAGISISLGILVVYLQFFENIGFTAIPLTCILFYVGFGAFGFTVLPWSMIAELYPTKYITVLGQLTSFFFSLCYYINLQLYPMMVTQNRNAPFCFFCIIAIIGTIFLTIALPETRAKTKTQVEEAFRGKSEKQVEKTFRKIEDA